MMGKSAMRLWTNPPDDCIRLIIMDSRHRSAKWVRSGDRIVYFRPEDAAHAEVAQMMHMDRYDKGIAIL